MLVRCDWTGSVGSMDAHMQPHLASLGKTVPAPLLPACQWMLVGWRELDMVAKLATLGESNAS